MALVGWTTIGSIGKSAWNRECWDICCVDSESGKKQLSVHFVTWGTQDRLAGAQGQRIGKGGAGPQQGGVRRKGGVGGGVRAYAHAQSFAPPLWSRPTVVLGWEPG